MKRQYIPWYAIAVAIVIVGAFAFGAPVWTVLLLLVALACPVMMMFMMGGMGGMGGGQNHDSGHDSTDIGDHRDSAGRS